MRLAWMFIVVVMSINSWVGNAYSQATSEAHEYLIAPGVPNSLFIFDAHTFKYVKEIVLPSEPTPLTATLSPDNKTLFVTTDRGQSVLGVDLPSGKIIFQANASTDDMRVAVFPGVAVSSDGQWVYIHQSSVRLLSSEYKMLPYRISAYRVSDGLNAKPVYSYDSPAKIFLLLSSQKKQRFFAIGEDIDEMDGVSGEILSHFPVMSRSAPGFGSLDYFPYWAQGSQRVGIFSVPYYINKISKSGEKIPAFGLLSVNVESGDVTLQEILDGDPAITYAWRDPIKPEIAYTVGTKLTRLDMQTSRKTKQVDLDRSYKQAISTIDGKTIFIGGGFDNILVFDAESFEKIGTLKIPTGADQGNGFLIIGQWIEKVDVLSADK